MRKAVDSQDDAQTESASGLKGEHPRRQIAPPTTLPELSTDDRRRFPALARAVDPGPPVFADLVTAKFGEKGPDREVAEAMRRFYPVLFARFAQQYGQGRYHWCVHIKGAAALTGPERFRGPQRLWLVHNPSGTWPEAEQILASCIDLIYEIEYHLRGAVRRRWQIALYELVTTTLALLDARAAPDTDRPGLLTCDTPEKSPITSLDYVQSRLVMLHRRVERAATSALQLRYVVGMASAAVAFAAALISTAGLRGLGVDAAAAGAAGAGLSTLVRMSNNRGLDLDEQLSPLEALLLGAFRTCIGAAFGAVVYLLLQSGIVAVTTRIADQRVYFYLVVAFAAGFSERLIPDTLGAVGAMVAVQGRQDSGSQALASGQDARARGEGAR